PGAIRLWRALGAQRANAPGRQRRRSMARAGPVGHIPAGLSDARGQDLHTRVQEHAQFVVLDHIALTAGPRFGTNRPAAPWERRILSRTRAMNAHSSRLKS